MRASELGGEARDLPLVRVVRGFASGLQSLAINLQDVWRL